MNRCLSSRTEDTRNRMDSPSGQMLFDVPDDAATRAASHQ